MQFKLSETGMLSSTSKAFVERDQNLINILGETHPYWHPEKAIQLKADFSQDKRTVLADTLTSCYNAIAKQEFVHPKVLENIESLRNSNTYTVTTGQQLHLFIGPAFVIYKILSVVHHCDKFAKQFPDKKFVPVYWMASEDHDFDEIKSSTLFKKTFVWQTESGGACGRLKTDSVNDVIEAIKSEINLDERQLKLMDEMAQIYNTSHNLSEATRRIINKFFGEYGVIVMDGDLPVFKAQFKTVIKNDLFNNSNQEAFHEVSNQLEETGLSTQLHGRLINLFYLNGNTRKRIVKENEHYLVKDGQENWTEEELSLEVENHPERFSPNAMLRPLYQETILPNIAYIGGNAEITYWIQLHKTMSINGLTPPSLILRPSVWITPSKITQWLEKRGISPLKVLITRNKADLLNLIQTESTGIEQETSDFIKLRERIQSIVAQNISKELKGLVEAGKQYEKSLKGIEKSLIEFQIEKNSKEMDKLEEIRDTYLNINNIQERKMDSLELLIKFETVVFSINSAVCLDNSNGWIINL